MLGNRLGEHKSIYVPDYVVFDLETTAFPQMELTGRWQTAA